MPDGSSINKHSTRQCGFAESSRFPVRRWAQSAAAALADLLFPPVCLLCQRDLYHESLDPTLCASCREELLDRERPVCSRCARPLPCSAVNGQEGCPACARGTYRFEQTTALGVYRGRMRDAVLRVKQRHQEPLTLALGRLLAERLRGPEGGHDADVIIPVPMHWMRRLTRGVNGPELLAEVAAGRLALPVEARLVCCQRRTRKQGTLFPAERRRNVRGAFAVTSAHAVRGARVLLVDDVMTTGATANEIARVLYRAGAARVSLAVLARGLGF